MIREQYQLQTWLKLRGCLDDLDQYETRMAEDHHLLFISLENT